MNQWGGIRRYKITKEDGTIEVATIEDVSDYDQIGDMFGADQINATNKAVNESADASKILDSMEEINQTTQYGYMAGALAIKELQENIGDLNVNVEADFLTADGFGNLRYYNNKFQYFNTDTETWVDTQPTADNPLIAELSPNPMRKMALVVDVESSCYKIIFKEPEDTVIDGQLLCAVEGIKFVRKLGSEPETIGDGILVLDYKRRNFSNYESKTYLDTSFTPNNGENWFYKAFPYSSSGFISNSSMNVASKIFKDYYLYGFKIDQNESDPASMISYLEDCDNTYFQPAYMDYTADTFNYGDWGNAWFIKKLKPCMLNYNGTVAYELDPNDYTKKKDGTDSDVSNESFQGNAMVGVPKVCWKIVDNGDDTANVYFSDKKVDNSFHCWSHIDNNGNEIPYCYMPIYNGSLVGNRLRSLSGKTPMSSKTAQQEIDYAKANNLTNVILWYTEVYSDRALINLLLLLIGKSTNTQEIYGNGNNNSYVSASNTGIKQTGTMNTKGLFYGDKNNNFGVKVFGMEHWWGNQWRRIAGWVNDNGIQKVKMTYGKSDGSTVNGYNTTGAGYIPITNATANGVSGGYIKSCKFDIFGIIPKQTGASATTKYCDNFYFTNNQISYTAFGNASNGNSYAGALSIHNGATESYAGWSVGASISCKPLATGGN